MMAVSLSLAAEGTPAVRLQPAPLGYALPAGPAPARTAFDPSEVGSAECLTPLLLEMSRSLRASAAPGPGARVSGLYVSEPPALAEGQSWSTPDGRIAIHYTIQRGSADAVPTADHNRNGLPDAVEAAGDGAMRIVESAETGGWLVPFTPSNRLDIYLANLSGVSRGYYLPALGEARGFAVIDSRLFSDPGLMAATAGHQAAHAILSGYDLSEPLWWHEATASLLEVSALGTVFRYTEAMERFLAAPEKGLLPDDPGRGGWGLLWADFLAESNGGVDIVRQIWDDASLVEGNTLFEATERVLSRQGKTLTGAFAEFTTWNLFTGLRDDRQHYSFGALLGDPHAGTVQSLFPAGSTGQVSPLGWTMIRLEPDGSGGGFHVTFEGDEGGSWQVDLLLGSRRGTTTYRRVALPVDGSGRGSLGVPWGEAAEAVLLVRNTRTSGPGASFTWSARPAPSYPFEMGSLSADPEPRQVRIDWETESEENLAAWDVYRSEGRGGFTRITEISIPAVGGSDGTVGYQFIDTAVRPGALYQYYVVGLTSDGLSQRSFIVTTRVPR